MECPNSRNALICSPFMHAFTLHAYRRILHGIAAGVPSGFRAPWTPGEFIRRSAKCPDFLSLLDTHLIRDIFLSCSSLQPCQSPKRWSSRASPFDVVSDFLPLQLLQSRERVTPPLQFRRTWSNPTAGDCVSARLRGELIPFRAAF